MTAPLSQPDNPESTNSSPLDSNESVVRGVKARFIFVALLLAAFAVIINWPYEYERKLVRTAGNIASPVDFDNPATHMPVMAGWPFRYSISYSDVASGPSGASLRWR